jgi:N-acetylmuramoyl-L-alanine amidase
LNHFHSSRRLSLGLILIVLLLPGRAEANEKSNAWARNQFTRAERMREALAGHPAAERTRRDYQQVIARYREIYGDAPNSSKADPSIVAVAELLVEMGRHFDDDDILRSAIRQYEFLRHQYPGSKHRFEALFLIGTIYQDDLDDPVEARAVFAEFLRRYPHHHLADDARAALSEPVERASLTLKDERNRDVPHRFPATDATQQTKQKNRDLAEISSIRHWSTPDYTRVAIDLEQDVKFDARPMDRPNRIVVDLLDTKVAATLLGNVIDVEDGLVKKIRASQFQPGQARVVLEIDDSAEYKASLLSNPSRLIIDIQKHRAKNAQSLAAANQKTGSPEGSSTAAHTVASAVDPVATPSQPKKRIVEDDENNNQPADNPRREEMGPARTKAAGTTAAGSSNVPSAKLDLSHKLSSRSSKRKRQSGVIDASAREARPTASGDRSLIRALGLKIGKIVIDPGHGGHDTGTIGPKGLEEKDLVLEVGRRLGTLLEARLGAEVIYTRTDDTFVPLETRTSIANQERADLFVSIHANSSRDPDARGVETYYLNFTSSSEALEVAARENSASDKSIHELQELVKTIALKEKIEESREFAADVQRSLHNGLAAKSPGVRDRGVKKAPFVVLIGANMPSILAEISFVSNPGDERRLRTAEYRQRIAESLYRGIAKYVSGLSGVKVASRIEKSEGQ